MLFVKGGGSIDVKKKKKKSNFMTYWKYIKEHSL